MIRAASPSIYVAGRLRALPRRADWPAGFQNFRRRRLGDLNPLALTSLANAIQTQEGYYPGSVAYVNNNPGNLVYAGQAGATPGPNGFAVFSSYSAGYQALLNQINLDATRGTDVNGNPTTTVGQLISSWAPASAGNDTAAYISSVTAQTGYDAGDSLLNLGAGDPSDTAVSYSPVGDTASVASTDGSSASSTSYWLIAAAVAGVAVVSRWL